VKDLDAGLQLSYTGMTGLAMGDVKYHILICPFYLAASSSGDATAQGVPVLPSERQSAPGSAIRPASCH
jgi:hypothetical protein